MSAVVTERWSERNVSFTTGTYRANRIFDVTGVTTQRDAIVAVVAYDTSTAYNATHPQSTYMYVDGQIGDPAGFNVWKVTISYSSNPAGRHFDPGNPLAEPVKYRFDWGTITEGFDRDAFGNIIQNTALQSFANAAPADVLNGWLICQRNEPFYNAQQAVAFSNAVNNTTVSFGPGHQWTLFKGQACCRRILPITPITASSVYVTVEYQIELRGGFKQDPDGYYDGFKLRIENVGTQGWWNNGGTKTRGPIIELIKGEVQNVSFPVRLDDVGKPMLSNYLIGKAATPGYATPVAAPNNLPSTTTIESTGDAYFIKQFPACLKLLDLGTLGL